MTLPLRQGASDRQVVDKINEAITHSLNATGAIERPLSDKIAEIISVKDFGAVGDGVTDDTAAIQAAIDAAYGKTLRLLSGKIAISNINIVKPITIIGEGIGDLLHSAVEATYDGCTRFVPVPGSTGYALNIQLENSPPTTTTIRNHENQLFSVNLYNFSIDGLSRSEDWGGIQAQRLDHSVWEGIGFIELSRSAIDFKANCREMTLRSIFTRYCGSDTTYPCIDLSDDETYADATNNIWLTDSYLIFSLGTAIYIDSSSTTIATRRCHFDNILIHGIVPQLDGVLYSFTTAQKQHKLLHIRGGEDLKFSNIRFHAAGLDTANVTQDDSTGGMTASGTRFIGCEFNEHYIGSTSRYGIDINTGDMILSANTFRGHSEGSWNVEVGATIHDAGGNVIITGADGVVNGTFHNYQYSEQQFLKDVYIKGDKTLYVSLLHPRTGTGFYIKDENGVNVAQIDADNLFKIESAAYDSKHLKIGGNHLWLDIGGLWRTNSTAPTSNIDGEFIADGYSVISVISTGTTSIDALGANVLSFSPAGSLTVTDFTGTDVANGKTLFLRSTNANTTIQYGASTIITKTGADVVFAANSTMYLKRIEGKWYEF